MHTGKSREGWWEMVAFKQRLNHEQHFHYMGINCRRLREEQMGDTEKNGLVLSVSPLCYSLWMRWYPLK